jgi:hypothetical protein
MATATATTAAARTTAGGGAAAADGLGLPRLGWRTELRLFLAAYLAYTLARWVFVGDLDEARDHARWIFELEIGLVDTVSQQAAVELTGAPQSSTTRSPPCRASTSASRSPSA